MENKFRQFNMEQILEFIKTSNSYVELTNKMGLDPNIKSNKKRVERYIKELDLSVDNFDSIKRLKDSKNRWTKERLQDLVIKYNNYNDILIDLGVLPVTTNYNKLKNKFIEFDINFDKLKQKTKNINIVDWNNEEHIKEIVSSSFTQKEVLKKLNIGEYGSNYLTFKKYINLYKIDISHFNKNYYNIVNISIKNKIDLKDILVENSTYSRTSLKERLYKEGLKERKCELCGQDEEWNGNHMSLILDHINGIHDDNRIKNLRIVCPNCNATLDTHCGKNNIIKK